MYIDLHSPLVSTEIRVKQIKRNAKMMPQSEISQTVTAVKRKLVGEKKRKQTRVEPGFDYFPCYLADLGEMVLGYLY